MLQWLPDTINKIESSTTLDDIKEILINIQQTLKFDFILYGINLSNSLNEKNFISFGTFPTKWMKKYEINNYASIDPVYQHCISSNIPICWEKFYTDKDLKIRDFFADACTFGLLGGISLGFKPANRESGIFSMAKEGVVKEKGEEYCNAVLYMTALQPYIHNAIQKLSIEYHKKSRHTKLTKRETECLSLIAKGKTAKEVAIALQISESTVTFHLKNSIEKLEVSNRVQAIARAIFMGIISSQETKEPICLTYNKETK